MGAMQTFLSSNLFPQIP